MAAGVKRTGAGARLLALLLAGVLLFGALGATGAADAAATRAEEAATLLSPGASVVVVPVHGEVEFGLERFIARALREAEAAGASIVVLELDTPGGRVDAAHAIATAVERSATPTVAYVAPWALSAGALIALSADYLFMAPGGSIGAAEPRPADEKTISALRADFAAAAERNGRDPQIAAAMVDARIVIEGVVAEGELLTLTAAEAEALGFSDGTAANRRALLAMLGNEDATVTVLQMQGPERFVRFITSPLVAPLLLAAGLGGLVFEALTPGLGLPGLIGALCLALYFGGHILAGLAGWEVLAIFLAGVLLLLAEVFTAGFGILGISGLIAMGISIFMTAPTAEEALRSLLLTLVVAVAAAVILIRLGRTRGLWRRLMLGTRLEKQAGYVAATYPAELIGREGVTVTPLRPAGTVLIDGKRWDVVTEGEYIGAGQPVRVIDVQGPRIVVSAAPSPEGEAASTEGSEA